ncbi:MAG TPA: serpin family protein [Planctomycetota bacterium]|nr:serpin family protein [Planctomycetota bacterium]
MLDADLYRRLAVTPGNLFFSPYSIAAALSMVHAGAAGKTKEEFTKVLGSVDYGVLGKELARRSELTPTQKNHLQYMPEATPDAFGCHLTVANALWRQKGYPVRAEYVDALKTGRGAEIGEADFQGAKAQAVRAINDWAAKATRDKIKNVLSEQQVDDKTRVILANAIYFKARWEDEFSEYGTEPRPFTLADGKKVSVPTMRSLGWRETARDGKLAALKLPYSGDKLAMLILLPDVGAMAQVEKDLEDGQLERLLGGMKSNQTEVSLPKFKIESAFQLKTALQSLGLSGAFSSSADFSGISAEPGFALSEVLHKTFVDVNEKGTEAAAVTVPMAAGSAPPKKNVEFKADRPFLFVIRDLPTETTLFMGRVADPRGP